MDISIDIATAHSASAKIWKNKKVKWSEFTERIKTTHKTNETFKEYKSASKIDQGKIKDVGGFFGGFLRNGRRGLNNVVHKQLLTLDIDYGYLNLWDDFIMLFDCEALMHTTHSHSEEHPRFRLLIPLDRETTTDEHIAIARKVAELIGLEYFDNTTFDINRMMFWPSVSKDVEYVCKHQIGSWLSADEILGLYVDWTDVSSWPSNKDADEDFTLLKKKQENPLEKKGLVGAFCRTYTIGEAIDTYLNDVYIKSLDGRYTYVKGSTANGLVLYEDLFAFSHHSTDPISGKLCNAFDLVRIHKFGGLDDPGKEHKSFKAMEDLIQKDKAVKKTIAKELLLNAKLDFNNVDESPVSTGSDFDNDGIEPDDIEWMAELETDAKGNYLSISPNLNLIFKNDSRLHKIFAFNAFDAKQYLMASPPWRNIDQPEPIKNVDYSGVRNYIECLYGITSMQKIEDSLNLEFQKNIFNPVLDYLKALNWDGQPRVDTLLIDYFGCEDTLYTREAIRKTLVGAVARIFDPGCKFDLMLTIVGGQGEGKSTFIKKLGREWYSDTFLTVHGKEALEQIQGAWIIEIAELSGFRKADMEAVKHFISKQVDQFRPAYGRTSETYRRMCIFIGTTNKHDFLRDPTGNRRFLPVVTNKDDATKSIWVDLNDFEVSQIWAEAVQLYMLKEPLFMSNEAAELALAKQQDHSEQDERYGLISEYLNTKLPDNWDSLDVMARRMYLADSELIEAKGVHFRNFVCVAEIWSECLKKEKEDMTRYNTREINDILRNLPDWDGFNSTKNFKLYGKQKYYARKLF